MYDIFFDLHEMHQTVDDDDKEETVSSSTEEQFAFDFTLDLPSEEDDREVIVNKPQICKQCQEIYPYAVPNQKDGSFKCYSCRIWG